MKNSIIIWVALLMFSAGNVNGQKEKDSVVNRNVTVEREYQPVIKDAGKITVLPDVLDPKVAKQKARYLNLDLPMAIGKNSEALPSLAMKKEDAPSQSHFLSLGAGNFWNTYGKLALPVIEKKSTLLDLKADHEGAFGAKKFSSSSAALHLDQLISGVKLKAGFDISHTFFNFYGRNFDWKGDEISSTNNPLLNTLVNYDQIWRYSARAGVSSAETDTTQLGLQFQFDQMNIPGNISEKIISSKFSFNHLYKGNKYGLDLKMYNLLYQSQNHLPSFAQNYTVLSLQPYFKIEKTNWFARVGLRAVIATGTGRVFSPSPDVTGEWKAFPEFLTIYGGVSGDYQVNSMNDAYDVNPYLYSIEKIEDTYTPVNPHLGVKIKVLHNLMLDGAVHYSYIQNQYFFTNTMILDSLVPNSEVYTNRFSAEYSSASLLKVAVRAHYNWKNTVNVQIQGAYNKWDVSTEARAWLKPAFEAGLSADYKVNKKLSLNLNSFLVGDRYAKLGNMEYKLPAYVDVNVGANYVFNKWFSAFAKVNNLLNQNYQHYYGYEVQGFNFLLGGAVTF